MMVGLWNEDADEGGYMVGGLPPLLLLWIRRINVRTSILIDQ